MSDESSRLSLHVFIYLILIAGLGVSGYYNYLHLSKSKQAAPMTAACESFEQLPEDAQALYVNKEAYNALKASLEKLEQDVHVAPMVASEKTMTETKISKTTQKSKKKEEEDNPFSGEDLTMVKDFAKCYDMDNANYKISKQCRKDIVTYVDKHKDAKYFEIIAIVDAGEFRLFNQIESDPKLLDTLGTNPKLLAKLKKFTQRGLGKNRAAEASWVIKSHTKREAATYNANYELVSKKGHRGVIIRAYE